MHPKAQLLQNDIRLDDVMPGETEQPQQLKHVLTRLAVPAVSAASISGGAIDWAEAWGTADTASGAPGTPETLFQAGSVSKPVAALAALRAVAAGLIALDEPINDRLRSWRVPANGAWTPRVTLRQLLSHTSGLTVHGFPGYPVRSQIPSAVDVLDGRGNTAPVCVRTLPGLQYSYSGGGYVVMQTLLEDILDMPFPQVARELVFDEVGMTDSTYEQPLPRDLWSRAASGHRTGGVPVAGRWHAYPEMAAAGLWTTPRDLAKFIIGVRAAHRGGGLLPVSLAEEMLTQQAPNFPIGLGVKLGDGIGGSFRGAPTEFTYGHGGDDQGFLAVVLVTDESGDGAVVMSNSDQGGAVVVAVVEAIARAHGWGDGGGDPGAAATAPDRLDGRYRLSNGTIAELSASGDDVILFFPDQEPIEFKRTGASSWAASVVNATISAGTDEATSFVLHHGAMYVRDEVPTRLA